MLLLISVSSYQLYSQVRIVSKQGTPLFIATEQQEIVPLTLDEFRQIAKHLNELEYLRNENAILKDQKYLLQYDLADCTVIDNYRKLQIANLQQTIKEVKPAWYDNFWFGAAASAIIVSGFYILSK